jgi:DNA-binding SARP family transcriptional activator
VNQLVDPLEASDGSEGMSPEPSAVDAPDASTCLPSQTLPGQLVEDLARLQGEYRQIRIWLESMQDQLSQREARVKQCLRDTLILMGRVDRAHRDPPPICAEGPAADGPVLCVRAFGKFAVQHLGQTVSLGSNKTGRAVFRYLATRSERHASKDVLLERFWPDDTPHSAAHKLHIAIGAVRRALNEALGDVLAGEESLVFADNHYALAPSLRIELDAELFSAHVQAGAELEREGAVTGAVGEYESARALYRGSFLVEDLYADWTTARRARFEEMFLTLLGSLARYYADQGDYTESITCCRHILARDSFREDAYRQLMCCYSQIGRRNQALREFQACKEVLRRELGVDPMRETVALYERIAREEPI